jgi:hypothetical protein
MRNSALHYIGTASLILSVLAIILPWFLFIRKPFTTTEPCFLFLYFLYGVHSKLVFYVLAIIALIAGIISRKTKLGKAGLIISAVGLVYVICCWVFIVCYFFYMNATGQSWF